MKNKSAAFLALLSALVVISGAIFQTARAADPRKGAEVFAKYCNNCHSDDGSMVMPGLPDFRRGDSLMKPDFELAASIRKGRMMMPAFEGILTSQNVEDVIAYLRTMQ